MNMNQFVISSLSITLLKISAMLEDLAWKAGYGTETFMIET